MSDLIIIATLIFFAGMDFGISLAIWILKRKADWVLLFGCLACALLVLAKISQWQIWYPLDQSIEGRP